jgi:hypothetical protein
LITRIGWDARLVEDRLQADASATLAQDARAFVDYLLFVDETPLPAAVAGTSGFAEQFSTEGPEDSRGRSFRQLDLARRLLRYPCSYMIYSDAFDALPAAARAAIYKRMWQILSGQDTSPRYTRLSASDRGAIVDILRETKRSLPEYFQPGSRR